MHRATPAGFTLIELLVTIAIIGILGTYAWPSYVDYIRRGRIAEATGQLSTLRISMEQYYQDNRNYGTGTSCGIAMPAAGQFSYVCQLQDGGQGFVIAASGNRGSVSDFTYQIDQNGLRRTMALPAGWGTVPQDCWIASRRETC
jgi:type IV pilus assembly protein PilE